MFFAGSETVRWGLRKIRLAADGEWAGGGQEAGKLLLFLRTDVGGLWAGLRGRGRRVGPKGVLVVVSAEGEQAPG